MEELNIARFPRPVYDRIPNFVGSEEAVKRLVSIKYFSNSRVIKVNPDSPQRPVRRILLEKGKTLLVPTPRLKNRFLILSPLNVLNRDLSHVFSIRGSFKYGNKVKLNELPIVGGIVVGSVAVSTTRLRLVKVEDIAIWSMQYYVNSIWLRIVFQLLRQCMRFRS